MPEINPLAALQGKTSPPSKIRLIIVSAAVIAIVVCAAGAVGLVALASSAVPPATIETPAPADETPIDQEPSDFPLVEGSYVLPAGLDAETLATQTVAAFTAWDNAGTEDTLVDRALAENTGWDTLLPQVAREQAASFERDLFVKDWTGTNIDDFVERSIELNAIVLRSYVANAGYVETEKVLSVVETKLSESERQLVIDVEFVNAADTEKWRYLTYTISYRTVGNEERIYDVVGRAHQ